MRQRFAVQCRDCTFEREIELSEYAEREARGHYEETGHAVVALELPASG